MSFKVNNHSWRASSVEATFHGVPVPGLLGALSFMFIFVMFGKMIGFMDGLYISIAWMGLLTFLHSRGKSVFFYLRRFLFRLMTLNFKFRRLW